MIRGAKVTIGDKQYEIPPLTLEQLEEHEKDLALANDIQKAAQDPYSRDRYEAMARVIHSAIVRNYPEVKIEELRQRLDLGNIGIAWAAILGVSGLIQKGDRPPGEAEAQPGNGSTGTSSAAPSSPQPGGAGTKLDS